MDLRSTLRKAAGLLVELPPEEEEAATMAEPSHNAPASGKSDSTDKMWAELEQAAKKTPSGGSAIPMPNGVPSRTIEQIVRESQGPNLDQIKLSPETLPPATGGGESLDFAAIYASASLPQVPFSSEQVIEMLAALPSSLPLEVKRQMMTVSINAMGKAIGATPESIVADASRKLAALAAYADHLSQLTSEYTGAAEQKIADLQTQIEQIRLQVGAAQERQLRENTACATESHRLDDVLEFFSLDVPPSKHAG